MELKHVSTADQPSVRELSDEQLIDGARCGLDAHIGELYRRYSSRLFVRLYVETPTDAGEIVTDAFMDLPRLLEKYQEQGKFEQWLATVGFNLQRTRIRSRNRRRDVPGLDAVADTPSPRLTGRTFDEMEARAFLVDRLPKAMREVWELWERGYSHAEIAETLGISEQNSATIKSRAMKVLDDAARGWVAESARPA